MLKPEEKSPHFDCTRINHRNQRNEVTSRIAKNQNAASAAERRSHAKKRDPANRKCAGQRDS